MIDPHATPPGPARGGGGPPLVLRILLLLLGGLVVAQLVTLLLTVVFPPAPAAQRSLAEVAAALNGLPGGEDRAGRLERVIQAGPPDVAGPGWLTPGPPRSALARLLGVGEDDVRMAFYTPLPFAGTAPLRKVALLPDDGAMPHLADARLVLAQAQGGAPPPPAMPPPVLPTPGSGGPAQLRPGAPGPPPRDGFPPGLAPDGRGSPGGFGAAPAGGDRAPSLPPRPLIEVDPAGARPGTWLPGDGGAAVPPLLQGAPAAPGSDAAAPPPPPRAPAAIGPREASGVPAPRGAAPGAMLPPIAPPRDLPLDVRIAPRLLAPPTAVPRSLAPRERDVPAAVSPDAPDRSIVTPAPAGIPAASEPVVAAERGVRAAESPEPAIPLTPRPRGLFGLAPAPFVEGDFVAALRLESGRWAVVQPAPEPFPNAWQRRVLLWFAVAFAIVAPFGLLFARALVRPLTGFAEAAERLGRDPAAMVGRLDGPAEVGRAARAFNLMQSRLKSFVDDRTAMVGAISHDLRTPLTRLRFRIEEVDDEAVREGMIDEVAEMEAMIASVLAFIRDASTPGARERIDLRLLVEDVVEDAALVGGDVMIAAASAPLPVEVDPLGMRRLLANLVENAVKYGERARVRLAVRDGEAVAAVVDDGPGVPDDELERAFEPFYRTANARASDKRGSGLGLAVCRSIARAHGGDVRLHRSAEGFVAELRVPLALAA